MPAKLRKYPPKPGLLCLLRVHVFSLHIQCSSKPVEELLSTSLTDVGSRKYLRAANAAIKKLKTVAPAG